MKILIVRPFPNKVNMNSYNLQEIGLAKALVRKGHQCDVAYYNGRNKDYKEKIEFEEGLYINIIWLKGYAVFNEGIYPTLKKYIKDYDIIQISEYIGITAFILNKKYPNKCIMYHGPYYCNDCKGDIIKAKIFDNTLLKMLDNDKLLIATKSKLATEYIEGKKIKNVTTIGVGLDINNFKDKGIFDSKIVQELKSNKNDVKYLLYIGILEERRNILFMIDIFKEIVKFKHEYKLIIIGSGKKEYVDLCKQEIQKNNLKDMIIMYPKLEQKYLSEVYKISDAFLLPTKYEIFGMVMLEAMYFGLPVFTTYNGGSSTLINDRNGIVIENMDSFKWAHIIHKTITTKNIQNSIGKKAHETIMNNYIWDVLADKFIELYNKRINGV